MPIEAGRGTLASVTRHHCTPGMAQHMREGSGSTRTHHPCQGKLQAPAQDIHDSARCLQSSASVLMSKQRLQGLQVWLLLLLCILAAQPPDVNQTMLV